MISLIYCTHFQTCYPHPMQFYTEKTVQTGQLVETYRYGRPIAVGRTYGRRTLGVRSSPPVPSVDTGPQSELASSGVDRGRRADNVKRARTVVRRLVVGNGEIRPIFLTLTYAENMQNRQQAVDDVAHFIRRLRVWYPRIGYVYTLELQTRGAWHIHILLFGKEFIPWQLMQHMWNNGSIKVKAVHDALHAANYITKYMTKTYDVNGKGQRMYSVSKNLLRPATFWGIIGLLEDKGAIVSEHVYSDAYGTLIIARSYICKRFP